MTIYLDFAAFRGLTVVPSSYVDTVEKEHPGWIEIQLEHWARWIDTRLRKRYATPFAAFDALPAEEATPPTVQTWLSQLVTWRLLLKRGIDPNDLQTDTIKEDHDAAKLEVLEAANSDEGWFDLPRRTDENGSAITQGAPRSYSEQSPYVWTDLQVEAGRNEDESGVGSSG